MTTVRDIGGQPPALAVVGMACEYPDARSPLELWENVLAQRRAFRRLPAERLRSEDYVSDDPRAADRTYSTQAALIEGYEFDRVRFRVSGSGYRAADLAHWLALDVATRALADAGFPDGRGLPREMTGVLVGNTLTGEFSRAAGLRLRWPYVRRTVDAALAGEGWPAARRRAFLGRLEDSYKAPFPPVGAESLAGALSNTIAGRICNHLNLKGGGYTVDGACASSLLAIATACAALQTADLDVAVAGGVDLSLDPFELVGFAKAGALAANEMHVYDANANGFWPGEGCGFAVLMRHADAVATGRRVYAIVRGWGVSSDGHGGITRPEAEGQALALARAYRRAGFGVESVPYFEGHGTGTSVGDATELQVLSRARREAAGGGSTAAVIGSIKANIGHTKAAAGVAGFIKATMALYTQILPPTTACATPHGLLQGADAPLRVLREGACWPPDRPLRAAVSAMGFGGINSHVVLEGGTTERRSCLGAAVRTLVRSPQDAELFLLGAADPIDLLRQAERLETLAPRLSLAELADLAARLTSVLDKRAVRAAIVASSPARLASAVGRLRTWLTQGCAARIDPQGGVFLGAGSRAPRLGFLFPGQGAPAHRGGALRRRFKAAQGVYDLVRLPNAGDGTATEVAQPAIVAASLAALRVLDCFGLCADVGLGHSLGELTALCWAGAMSEESVLRIASARGRAMASLAGPPGAMASVGAPRSAIDPLLQGLPVVVAGLNAPSQTVISGPADAVAAVVARCRESDLRATPLPVSHAFHSPLVEDAVPVLERALATEDFRPLRRAVISTVVGAPVLPGADLRRLLARQVTSPVRFMDALEAAGQVDLLVEVGPGHVLSGLAGACGPTPVVPIDAGGPSLGGLLRALGAAFTLGAGIEPQALYGDRFVRPFNLDWRPRFFQSLCELAPLPIVDGELEPSRPEASSAAAEPGSPSTTPVENGLSAPEALGWSGVSDATALDAIRRLVAERTELPLDAVSSDSRLLSDLHLNSIAVGEIVTEAARRVGVLPPVAPTEYADATVGGAALALAAAPRANGGDGPQDSSRLPAGIDSWVRTFTVELAPHPQGQAGMVGARPSAPPATAAAPEWQVVSEPGSGLAAAVGRFLTGRGPGGVVVCLPPEPDEPHLSLLLEGAHAAARRPGLRFVIAQHGTGAASFARSFCLEHPETVTRVVDVPVADPAAADRIVAEAIASDSARFAEVRYDANGRRWRPLLRPAPAADGPAAFPLRTGDLLLVTGGGKGIAAECALMLGREFGLRLALMGRSRPGTDGELDGNLERVVSAGIEHRYLPVDVADAGAVERAVRDVVATMGPVAGILHAAGANVPALLRDLDESAFRSVIAPKVRGARNVLAAVDSEHLRLLVAFGSIIARTGMRGEAHYALANEWLARLVERYQREHPHCRCHTLEWSVWSSLGMGARLGRLDALVREGVTPIAPDEGIVRLRDLLTRPPYAVSVVVTGRFGTPPTLEIERPELPLLRFLERPRVFFPGIEIVIESELSGNADPYLDDHVFRGDRIFPAVMALEAMAQAVAAVRGSEGGISFNEVTFDRPVVVRSGTTVVVRVAALVQETGQVDVALRSSTTDFQVDHVRAWCAPDPQPPEAPAWWQAPPEAEEEPPALQLDPARDLYGPLLFHGPRFRRLRRFRSLRAKACVAEVTADPAESWFGPYFPQDVLLGDPGWRDAAIHAIQVCIPHRTVLPVGVERLVTAWRSDTPAPPHGDVTVHARERASDGETYVYDVVAVDGNGVVRERWDGLRLHRVATAAFPQVWAQPLLGAYLERCLPELLPGTTIALTRGAARDGVAGNWRAQRRQRSDAAIRQAAQDGHSLQIARRHDGKPELARHPELQVSTAHAGDLTLGVTGPDAVGCDLEYVSERSDATWADLLGPERLATARVISQETGESLARAATRVWGAVECLRKAGAPVDVPLVLQTPNEAGWTLLRAGSLTAATFVARLHGAESPLMVAALSVRRRASPIPMLDLRRAGGGDRSGTVSPSPAATT